MNIYDKIVETYPELTDADFTLANGSILLADDGDGVVYVKKWEYSKPIPSGMKLGK